MTENKEGLDDQGQFKYRSAVGMLLFSVNIHDQTYPIQLENYQR